MKKTVYQTKSIDITVFIDIVDKNDGILSTSYVKHPTSINKNRRLGDLKLYILDDLVASLINSIKFHRFPIYGNYQSKKDYTYYVQFQPIDENGNKLMPVSLKFRLASHSSSGMGDDDVTTATVRIKSFLIGNVTIDDSVSLMVTFESILHELEKGNVKILDEY